MYDVLTQLLAIPNYKVIATDIGEDTITLEIQSTCQSVACPFCGQQTDSLHERHRRTVRDLPISGKPCYLHFVRRRFFCHDCNRVFSESLDFVQGRRDYTNRYQDWIFHQVKENNITVVQRAEALTYDQIESIFFHEANSRIPAQPFRDLKRLGIDEVALRKGKQDFALILTNLDTGEVVEILQQRTQEKLSYRLSQLSQKERDQIAEVAIDMWKPYDTVCTALLPNADVTVDRFHVMQAINKELKQLKNQEKKMQPEAFKGAHYALLKNQQNLTDKQATALEQVYAACPPVKMAHRLKECLRRIFESHATKDLAQKRLDKWRQIAEKEKLFPEFCKTLANWADRITKE